ncbi:MAG: hypothetical protein FJ221_10925 [Lentisphaerae bacterium]|nr:hypothetical protein [Lentisphaerota bacterium]
MSPWLLSGVGLLVLSVLGGVVAVATGLRSARGPRERAFVRRACIASWAMVALFIVAAFTLPAPYHWISAVVFVFAVPAAIYRWTTQRQLLRELEARERRAAEGPDESAPAGR